jgi:hypothetical protein
VSAAAALTGTTQGLRALVNDTNPLYVQDDTPVDEPRYRARFHFDPNGFDTGEAQGAHRIRLFIAFDQFPSPVRIVTIILKRLGGAYSVQGRVRLDDTSRADTPFIPISDGPHSLEFDWRRSTAPGANNGTFEMWVDGNAAASLTGLDTDVGAIDFARLGVISAKTGASGTVFLDEFESRRQNYIGP